MRSKFHTATKKKGHFLFSFLSGSIINNPRNAVIAKGIETETARIDTIGKHIIIMFLQQFGFLGFSG